MATCKRLPTWVKYSRPSNPFAKRHYPQVGIAVSDVAATTQWSTLRAYLQILALLPLAIVQLHEILLFSLFPSFFFFHALQRCASSLPRFSSPLPPLRPLRRRRSTCVRTLVGRPSPQRSAPSSRTLFSAAQCSVNARTLTAPSPPPPAAYTGVIGELAVDFVSTSAAGYAAFSSSVVGPFTTVNTTSFHFFEIGEMHQATLATGVTTPGKAVFYKVRLGGQTPSGSRCLSGSSENGADGGVSRHFVENASVEPPPSLMSWSPSPI